MACFARYDALKYSVIIGIELPDFTASAKMEIPAEETDLLNEIGKFSDP
jgi:hypothetical protein